MRSAKTSSRLFSTYRGRSASPRSRGAGGPIRALRRGREARVGHALLTSVALGSPVVSPLWGSWRQGRKAHPHTKTYGRGRDWNRRIPCLRARRRVRLRTNSRESLWAALFAGAMGMSRLRRCFDSVIVLNGTATVAMVHLLRGSPTPVTHHRTTNIPSSS